MNARRKAMLDKVNFEWHVTTGRVKWTADSPGAHQRASLDSSSSAAMNPGGTSTNRRVQTSKSNGSPSSGKKSQRSQKELQFGTEIPNYYFDLKTEDNDSEDHVSLSSVLKTGGKDKEEEDCVEEEMKCNADDSDLKINEMTQESSNTGKTTITETGEFAWRRTDLISCLFSLCFLSIYFHLHNFLTITCPHDFTR